MIAAAANECDDLNDPLIDQAQAAEIIGDKTISDFLSALQVAVENTITLDQITLEIQQRLHKARPEQIQNVQKYMRQQFNQIYLSRPGIEQKQRVYYHHDNKNNEEVRQRRAVHAELSRAWKKVEPRLHDGRIIISLLLLLLLLLLS
jgi:hypothetical protein